MVQFKVRKKKGHGTSCSQAFVAIPLPPPAPNMQTDFPRAEAKGRVAKAKMDALHPGLLGTSPRACWLSGH